MKSWLISNCNEKTITVKTGAIFKTHPLYLSSKFILHKCPIKESQWYSQETVTQKKLKVAPFYFCKVI